MIREDFKSAYEAWDTWLDESAVSPGLSVVILSTVRKTVHDKLWLVKTDQEEEPGCELNNFGAALKTTLTVFGRKFK